MPLLSLVGLYAYATTAAASNAITLARATSVLNSIDDPTGLYVTEVQQERRVAALFLARPSAQAGAALSAQEPRTDAELLALRGAVARIGGDEDPGVRSAIAAMLRQAAGLPALRARVSSRSLSAAAAEQDYTTVIAAGFGAIGASFQQMPDVDLVGQTSAVLRVA